ncbi:MAG: hypothetical protein HYS23_15960 [Geobacter sp.]|nr:hypothetical protein [Geobacter sp.]
MIKADRALPFLLPSISDILFLTVFLYLSFSAGKGLLNDADTGYHIRAGEYILNTLSIPRNDIFSFITPTMPWTAHEWLSEVIMALVHKAFGLTGIVLFFSFLISLTYFLLFKIIRACGGNIFAALLVGVLVIGASQIHWLARPHIFSLLLMLGWYHILNLFQYREKNRLWLLPLLMVFWVNLHGGYVTGFILLGIYFAGNMVQAVLAEPGTKEPFRRKYRTIALIIAVCIIASLANPFGYHILLFPFNLVGNRYLMDHVSEFISPNFHEPLPFKYLLFLMIAAFAFSREKLNIIELVLVLFFTNMALYSARYIPLFAIITAPVILRQGDTVLNGVRNNLADFFRKKGEGIASLDASSRGYVWPVAGFLAVAVFAGNGTLKYTFDPKMKPVAAVEFLKKERISGNMFNNDEFGDYIIYAAWPEYRVFFDGRSDMYGVKRMKEYYRIMSCEPGWEKILEKYRINWVIFDAKSTLSRFLLKEEGWRLVYADKLANIFVRNLPEYRSLISRYPNVKPVAQEDKDDNGL